MIKVTAAFRIVRMMGALLVAFSLALLTTSCAVTNETKERAVSLAAPITFRCDGLNSTPSPHENTCWSVFKKSPGRTPTYDRVAVAVTNCPASLRCWTNNTSVTNKCKVIPANGTVPATSLLQNCPV